MKCLTAITAILLLGSNQVYAQNASDTDVLLGAGAGAAIGSTIGQGDGKKIATVLGALIGAQMARDSVASNHYRYSRPIDSRAIERNIYRQCSNNVPRSYWGYPDAQRAWTEGCVERKRMLMLEVQQQAYEDGLNGIR